MNENLNLVEILKDCPKGTKLYSTLFGDVELVRVCKSEGDAFPIEVKRSDGTIVTFMKNGKFYFGYSNECALFPSREQRDWSKFTAPRLEKERFDPKTLKHFDKVLARMTKDGVWHATFFSHYDKEVKWGCYPFVTTSSKSYSMCIPYNDDTKHLVGTNEEAPEYYRYWED